MTSDRTSALGHPQFSYAACPTIFGARTGHGPLLVAPDTNVLIDLIDEFASVESHFGFGGSVDVSDCEPRIGALRRLFALWFFRDVRWVVSDRYLDDSKKGVSDDELRNRERVLETLSCDLWERGGLGTSTSRGRRAREVEPYVVRAEHLLSGHDGLLVGDALRLGAHVFLTEDRRVLARRSVLAGWGLSVLRPVDLVGAVIEVGEMESDGSVWRTDQPAPDLLALTRFYEIPHDDS